MVRGVGCDGGAGCISKTQVPPSPGVWKGATGGVGVWGVMVGLVASVKPKSRQVPGCGRVPQVVLGVGGDGGAGCISKTQVPPSPGVWKGATGGVGCGG